MYEPVRVFEHVQRVFEHVQNCLQVSCGWVLICTGTQGLGSALGSLHMAYQWALWALTDASTKNQLRARVLI